MQIKDLQEDGPNEPLHKDYPSIKCQRPSRMADERVEIMFNFLSLSLKADEAQIGQRHKDVERKGEYYLIIFPERT